MKLVQIYSKIYSKITIITNFLAFFSVVIFEFFFLDQDPEVKMNADPDPQPWFLLIQITHSSICLPPPAGALPRP